MTSEEIQKIQDRVHEYRQREPNATVKKLIKDLKITPYQWNVSQGGTHARGSGTKRQIASRRPSYSKVSLDTTSVSTSQLTALVLKGDPQQIAQVISGMYR